MVLEKTLLKVTVCFLAVVHLVKGLSSIPLGSYRYNELETHVVQIKSPSKPIAASYQSLAIPFREIKKTAINENNVLLGIAELDYITRQISAGEYQIDFYQALLSLSQTQLTLQVIDNLQRISMLKTSIMILSNEHRYESYFQIFLRVYTPSNSYTELIPIRYSITPTVLSFLCGMNLKSTVGILEYSFAYTLNMAVSPPTITTKVMVYNGGHPSAFVRMKLLVYYEALFASASDMEIFPYFYLYSSIWLSMYLSVPKIMMNSEVFYGLNFVSHSISTTSEDRFRFSFIFTTPNQIMFKFDVPAIIIYQVLVINHFACDFPSHYIFAKNSSSNLFQCFDQCSTTNQFSYFDTISRVYKCAICPVSCSRCFNATVCTSCLDGYYLTENNKCFLNATYYLVSLMAPYALHCSSQLFACQTCFISGGFCTSCLPDAYVFSYGWTTVTSVTIYGSFSYDGLAVGCKFCDSLWPGCYSCNTTVCFTCKSGLYLENYKTCTNPPIPPVIIVIQPCTDSLRCETCLQTNLDNCLKCFSSSLQIINGKCTSPCGDGIVIDSEVCDDGNTLSYDGCSSDCLAIEDGWTCQSNALLGRSQCHHTLPILLKVVSIKKVVKENKVTILMGNSNPFLREWMSFNASELKAFVSLRVPQFEKSQNVYNFEYGVKFIKMPPKFLSITNKTRLLQTSTTDSFEPQQFQCIEIQVMYTSDQFQNPSLSLSHQQVIVTFSPIVSGRFIFQATQPSEVQFELITDDNTFIQYFSPSYYQKFALVRIMSLIVGILTFGFLLISFLAFFLDGNNSRQILLAIETAGIVQFTYFSLIGIGELNPLFVAIAEGLKYSGGFDILFSDNETTEGSLLGVGIQSSSFIDNVNLSFGVVFLFFVIGLVFLIVSKIKERKNLRKEQESDQNIQNEAYHNEEQKNEERTETFKTKTSSQSKLAKLSKIFLINFAFGCFIFFLYKSIAFMSIQIKFNSGSMAGLDTFIMGLTGTFLFGYTFLMFLKFDLFEHLTEKLSSYQTFEEKEKRLSEECETDHITLREKKKKLYFVFIITERIVNSMTLIFLYESFNFHGLIPILLAFSQIVYVSLYDKNVYNPSNKYRLYLTCLIGIIIQILLLYRKTLMDRLPAGTEESDFGLYLPFSILSLLLILLSVSLSFALYSIKKIRCFQLSYDWEKIDPSRKKELQAAQNLRIKMLENSKIAQHITKIKTDYKNQRLNQVFNTNETQKNIVQNEYSSKKSEQHFGQQNSINNLKSLSKKKNQIDFETQKSRGHNKHNKNLFHPQKNENNQSPKNQKQLLNQKIQMKKDIKNMLKASKIPKQGKRSQMVNHEEFSETGQRIDQIQKKVQQSSYKYTDRYRYNFYEVYDQI